MKWNSCTLNMMLWPYLPSYKHSVIIFHFEGMSFSSAHDLKQWDFLDNNEIFLEFAQFIRQYILTILTIKQLVVKRPSLTRCAQTPLADDYLTDYSNRNHAKKIEMLTCFVIVLNTIISRAGRHRSNVQQNA